MQSSIADRLFIWTTHNPSCAFHQSLDPRLSRSLLFDSKLLPHLLIVSPQLHHRVTHTHSMLLLTLHTSHSCLSRLRPSILMSTPDILILPTIAPKALHFIRIVSQHRRNRLLEIQLRYILIQCPSHLLLNITCISRV